ncbi:MAG: hypothetical protein B6I20_00220 [Bacteroidetes bacterium 4572_117]|nr:MAG: hypothetical protein B6I20_00220 [Bacteroidetes bacterium 4572_117]
MIKKYYYLVVLLFIFTINGFSQPFEVTIETVNTNVCHDSVTFVAKTTVGGVVETGVSYTWNFDDNSSVKSGVDLDTIKHPFKDGGGYIVRVEAEKGGNTDYALERIQVSLTADFSETESDRQDPICLGQEISLTGIANTTDWKYQIPDEYVEPNPVEISQGNYYSSVLDFKAYTELQTVTSIDDIDTIGIKLEHTNLSNIRVLLSCPEGKLIILKDYGGQDKFFGEPIDDETSDQAGTPYYYYWTNNPDFGTMNSSSTNLGSLPAGSYTSHQIYNNLIGCSLNGEWTILIQDSEAEDKGFVFASMVKFKNDLISEEWEFENTYTKPIWSGEEISNTSQDGTANATPTSKDNKEYKFQVTDNFDCKQDTSLFVRVEGASFTADPTTGPFELDVTFINTTSWATDFSWDFGDESELSSEESPSHIYTYPDGKYVVLYTAKTDDGCLDTYSDTIYVTIPDAVFNKPPNVFSPNNDGANDIFKLDVDDIESLEGWIYSRWGKTVCKWKSVEEGNNGWDGKIMGSNREAVSGVYYYYIRAIDYHGNEIIEKGSLHLFR